jgi:hypothetical protein
MAETIPAIASLVPAAKPESRPVFQARWTPPASWVVKAPWGGWRRVPGTWKPDEAPAAVRRAFGRPSTKGAVVVVVDEKGRAPQQKGRTE